MSILLNNYFQLLWVCDGVPDCSNGEDEQECAMTCEATQYLCEAPHVINDTALAVANSAQTSTNHHYHRYCIPIKHVCDGTADCPNGDGEKAAKFDLYL